MAEEHKSEGQVEPGKEVVTPLPPQGLPPTTATELHSCLRELHVQFNEMWVHAGRGPAGRKSK